MPGSWYSQRIRSKRSRDTAAMASIAFSADCMRHSTIRKNVDEGVPAPWIILDEEDALHAQFLVEILHVVTFPADHDGGSCAVTGILGISSHPFVKSDGNGVDSLDPGFCEKYR